VTAVMTAVIDKVLRDVYAQLVLGCKMEILVQFIAIRKEDVYGASCVGDTRIGLSV
jgi:hypothetical protein